MATRLACYGAILFVLPLTYATFTDVCNQTYSGAQNLQCFPCSPGYTKGNDARCNEGTYQPDCLPAKETGECMNCTLCDVYKQNCTIIYKNATCEEGTMPRSGFTMLITFSSLTFVLIACIFASVFCHYRYHRKQYAKKQGYNDRKKCSGGIIWDGREEIRYKRNSIRKLFAYDSASSALPAGKSKPEVGKGKVDKGKGMVQKENRHPGAPYCHTEAEKEEISRWMENKKLLNDIEAKQYKGKAAFRRQQWEGKAADYEVDFFSDTHKNSIDEIPECECLFGIENKMKYIPGSALYLSDLISEESSQERVITGKSPEKKENTKSNVPTIECRETDKNKDSRRPAMNTVDVHVDGSYLDSYTTDISKVTEDVPKGLTNKLVEESKHIAVISPIQEAGVNKRHAFESNGYVEQQVTQERLQTTGDSENTPEGLANTEINWSKLFTELIEHLPIDEASWTFFAIALLENSKQVRGFPENVTNATNKIKGNGKDKELAYLHLFTRWHEIMGSEASLAHIKDTLKTFKNQIVMEEFAKIEQNPPTRKKVDHNTKTSINPLRQIEQYRPFQCEVITLAQYESTNEIAETNGILSHRRDGQIVENTKTRASQYQYVIPGPSGLARQPVKQRKVEKVYHNKSYHDRLPRSQLKKKELRWKSKVKKMVKKAEKKRKTKDEKTFLKNENIELIKIILPLANGQLSRQRYYTFLEYTVNKIMEHNHVARETVLSIRCKEYTECTKKAETNDGRRHILHCGNQKLMLDEEQYDCLALYGKFARTRVLKDIEGLEDSGDRSFLFITYEGSQYQKYSFESANSSSSTGSSYSETDNSDVSDMERGECRISTRSPASTIFRYPADVEFKNENTVSIQQKSRMSIGSATTTENDNPVDVRAKPHQLPAISENNTFVNNENMVPIQQNNADSTTSSRKRKHNQKIINNLDDNEGKKRCFEAEDEMPHVCIQDEENVNQEISVSTHVANINKGMQENDSDTSIEDLIKDIDKELATF